MSKATWCYLQYLSWIFCWNLIHIMPILTKMLLYSIKTCFDIAKCHCLVYLFEIPSYFCISSSYCAISSISESILQSILTCLNDFLCSKESFSSPCFEQKVGFNTYLHELNKVEILFCIIHGHLQNTIVLTSFIFIFRLRK